MGFGSSCDDTAEKDGIKVLLPEFAGSPKGLFEAVEEQIIAVLREGEAGARVADLCRKYGMSDATYYNWKAKYAGLTVSELKRLKSLEDENRRLKQIVADQALDIRALKELLSKNF